MKSNKGILWQILSNEQNKQNDYMISNIDDNIFKLWINNCPNFKFKLTEIETNIDFKKEMIIKLPYIGDLLKYCYLYIEIPYIKLDYKYWNEILYIDYKFNYSIENKIDWFKNSNLFEKLNNYLWYLYNTSYKYYNSSTLNYWKQILNIYYFNNTLYTNNKLISNINIKNNNSIIFKNYLNIQINYFCNIKELKINNNIYFNNFNYYFNNALNLNSNELKYMNFIYYHNIINNNNFNFIFNIIIENKLNNLLQIKYFDSENFNSINDLWNYLSLWSVFFSTLQDNIINAITGNNIYFKEEIMIINDLNNINNKNFKKFKYNKNWQIIKYVSINQKEFDTNLLFVFENNINTSIAYYTNTSPLKCIYYIIDIQNTIYKIIEYNSDFDFILNFFDTKNFYCTWTWNLSYYDFTNTFNIKQFITINNLSFKIVINEIHELPFDENEILFIFENDKIQNIEIFNNIVLNEQFQDLWKNILKTPIAIGKIWNIMIFANSTEIIITKLNINNTNIIVGDYCCANLLNDDNLIIKTIDWITELKISYDNTKLYEYIINNEWLTNIPNSNLRIIVNKNKNNMTFWNTYNIFFDKVKYDNIGICITHNLIY